MRWEIGFAAIWNYGYEFVTVFYTTFFPQIQKPCYNNSYVKPSLTQGDSFRFARSACSPLLSGSVFTERDLYNTGIC